MSLMDSECDIPGRLASVSPACQERKIVDAKGEMKKLVNESICRCDDDGGLLDSMYFAKCWSLFFQKRKTGF